MAYRALALTDRSGSLFALSAMAGVTDCGLTSVNAGCIAAVSRSRGVGFVGQALEKDCGAGPIGSGMHEEVGARLLARLECARGCRARRPRRVARCLASPDKCPRWEETRCGSLGSRCLSTVQEGVCGGADGLIVSLYVSDYPESMGARGAGTSGQVAVYWRASGLGPRVYGGVMIFHEVRRYAVLRPRRLDRSWTSFRLLFLRRLPRTACWVSGVQKILRFSRARVTAV